MTREFDVVTLFPSMFAAITEHGITGRASKNNFYRLHTWNPRDFTENNYRTVDDRPYGGGPGMVMLAEPLEKAIIAAKNRQLASGLKGTKVIYLSPQGRVLNHDAVLELNELPGLVLLAGRYEGIDENELKTVSGDMLSASLVALTLSIPLMMSAWFAPLLVIFKDMSALESMRVSFFACLKNVVAFQLYAIIILVLIVLAAMPYGLGLFVLVPTLFGSIYASYRDIFPQTPESA